jgi:hypothetical protein
MGSDHAGPATLWSGSIGRWPPLGGKTQTNGTRQDYGRPPARQPARCIGRPPRLYGPPAPRTPEIAEGILRVEQVIGVPDKHQFVGGPGDADGCKATAAAAFLPAGSDRTCDCGSCSRNDRPVPDARHDGDVGRGDEGASVCRPCAAAMSARPGAAGTALVSPDS